MSHTAIHRRPTASAPYHEEVNRLVHALLFGGAAATPAGFEVARVRERDDAIEVTAELPGVSADALEVAIEGTLLTLRWPGGAAERGYGSFLRCIELSGAVDSDRADARLAGDVLTLRLPRAARPPSRAIPVRVA
jgi:HSP20 family protein